MKAINKITNVPFEVVEITEKAVKLKMKNGAFLVITKAEFMKNYRVSFVSHLICIVCICFIFPPCNSS